MKKNSKNDFVRLSCHLPLFVLSACSSRSHFATQERPSGKPIPKKRKSKLVLMRPLFLWGMRERMVAMLVLILILPLQFFKLYGIDVE